MHLTLFNTLSRRKEVFTPVREDRRVGIYTCGPTVYADAHIGNLRSYIFPDVLKKLLRRLGYEVVHVINITDVGHLTSDQDTGEDKMERAAKGEGRSAWDIAALHTEHFIADLKRLNVDLPTFMPRATQFVRGEDLPDDVTLHHSMISLIQALEAKGVAYRTEDGIYYDTSRFPDYGKLARIKVEGLQEGARVEMGGKRNKTDFALWKFSPQDAQRQMEWDSPWGRGFPGWHIECSAMGMDYLGETFDIHTGGSDHIPVHHTNEIAQSEMATGKPFVRTWLHGEFLVLGEDKRMGKSEGNFLTLQSLIDDGFDPLDYRYLCLNTHYRKFLNFSREAMQAAKTALSELRKLVPIVAAEGARADWEALENQITTPDEFEARLSPRHARVRTGLLDALCDDLNTPKALGYLWTQLRERSLPDTIKWDLVQYADLILGLDLLLKPDFLSTTIKSVEIEGSMGKMIHTVKITHTSGHRAAKYSEQVINMAKERILARARRDFAKSDSLRADIESKGWTIRDRKDGCDLEPNA